MTDLEPLDHDIDLDDPHDVDWLYRWSLAAEWKIKELEIKITALTQAEQKAWGLTEVARRKAEAEIAGLRADAMLRR